MLDLLDYLGSVLELTHIKGRHGMLTANDNLIHLPSIWLKYGWLLTQSVDKQVLLLMAILLKHLSIFLLILKIDP